MKTQNPLIGRSRKSYGDATFYTLNGENIVRTKAMVVANPNTPAQEAQRVRFKAFIAAANSMSEADLKLLFATKEVGRNRRSMLQAQLAPAYGTQATSSQSDKERFEPTFDIKKIGDIGSGAVGYIGDLVELPFTNEIITISAANYAAIKQNMVDFKSSDEMLIVAIAEDGCVIAVIDTDRTFAQVQDEITESSQTTVNAKIFAGHGDKVHCYAVGGDQIYLQGFGSFIIKKGKRKTGSNKHNTPV